MKYQKDELSTVFFQGPNSIDIVEMALSIYEKAELRIQPVIVSPHRILRNQNITSYKEKVLYICDEDICGVDRVTGWLKSNEMFLKKKVEQLTGIANNI